MLWTSCLELRRPMITILRSSRLPLLAAVSSVSLLLGVGVVGFLVSRRTAHQQHQRIAKSQRRTEVGGEGATTADDSKESVGDTTTRNVSSKDATTTTTTPRSAHEALIGATPLVALNSLSNLTQRLIYVKMESLNPGGTGKDRAALALLRSAEESGALPPPLSTRGIDDNDGIDEYDDKEGLSRSSRPWVAEARPSSVASPATSRNALDATLDDLLRRAVPRSKTGGLVVEGTSGSTGISLALLARASGHACIVVMPDDQSHEKKATLEALGALVHIVPTASYSSPLHYVNLAQTLTRRANDQQHATAAHSVGGGGRWRAAFMDQFENLANCQTHAAITGPELWRQCCGGGDDYGAPLDAFVMSAGTGGTIAGVGQFLKHASGGACRIVLVDPPGSALYHRIVHGVAYAPQQRERSLRRHRYDTLAEGIGLDRVTRNVAEGLPYIDTALQVTDQEAVDMAHWLLEHEGLWVGSSSAMNVVGAVRTALELPLGSKVVTLVCDGGARHVTRFWDRDFCRSRGLEWPGDAPSDAPRTPECLQGLERHPKSREDVVMDPLEGSLRTSLL